MKAFIIKADGDSSVNEIDGSYESIKELVGGDAEYVTLDTRLSLCCNEMGKAYHLPFNEKATQVMRYYLTTEDWIAGDAVIYGIDEMGDSCSLSDEQILKIEKSMEG